MNEMIERVARAICVDEYEDPDELLDTNDPVWTDYISRARAAIEAMREPTDAMKEAGGNGVCGIIQDVGDKSEKHFVRLWHCAIDAALEDKKTGP
jgi:hypothetical protein